MIAHSPTIRPSSAPSTAVLASDPPLAADHPGRWLGGAVGALLSLALVPISLLVEPDGFWRGLTTLATLGLLGAPIGFVLGRQFFPQARGEGWQNAVIVGIGLGWLAPREAEARRATGHGVRVVILRIGFVLAPGGSALRLYALPFRFGLGGPIGDGRQWMSWIHVADVARIALAALDDDSLEGIINAVAPTPARQAEIAAAIGAAMGRRSWLRVPAMLVRLVMRSQAILPLGSRRIVPARLLERGFVFRWPDLGPAMADALGAAPADR